jgi:integrase
MRSPGRWQALAVTAAGCGLRQGEAFGLRVAEVDFLRHVVHVRQQVRQDGTIGLPKRDKTRDVPLPEHVALALAAHIERYAPAPDGLIFAGADGGPVDRRRFSAAWGRALDAAGLERIRANGSHALRHFYASTLLAAGVSVRAVADWLGHADGGALLLRVCAHVMPSDTERGRAVLDAAFSCEPGVSQAAQ